MTLSAERIRRMLPHRYPMLLVDGVTRAEPDQWLVAHKAVTVNEPWYDGHPDGAGLAYPPALIVESWGQAAALLATLGGREHSVAGDRDRDDRVLLFGSMSNVVFHREVLPGMVLEHHVRLFRSANDTMIFDGTSEVGGERVLEVERLVLAVRSPERLTWQE